MQVNRPGTCGSNFKPFVLCATLRASQYRPTYRQQYQEEILVRGNIALAEHFLKNIQQDFEWYAG